MGLRGAGCLPRLPGHHDRHLLLPRQRLPPVRAQEAGNPPTLHPPTAQQLHHGDGHPLARLLPRQLPGWRASRQGKHLEQVEEWEEEQGRDAGQEGAVRGRPGGDTAVLQREDVEHRQELVPAVSKQPPRVRPDVEERLFAERVQRLLQLNMVWNFESFCESCCGSGCFSGFWVLFFQFFFLFIKII